jgi:putative oxidoreductase
MKLASALHSLETFFAKLGGWLQAPLLLVLRLHWGWAFAQTGWGKLTHLDRTAGFFESLHIPAAKLNAVMAGSTECLGGTLLLLGLCTRFATPALVFTMIVAYATAEREALTTIFSDPDKFTGAAPFLFLLAALTVFAFGPGKLSLDALLRKKG